MNPTLTRTDHKVVNKSGVHEKLVLSGWPGRCGSHSGPVTRLTTSEAG